MNSSTIGANTFRLVTCVLCATGLLAQPSQAQNYDRDAPAVLRTLVRNAARDIVSQDPPRLSLLETIWNNAVFYAVADALTLRQGNDGVRRISPYRYYVETARTDKQVGASSGSSATTSLLEKPGIPSLLGLAIEHGAIDQEVSGTGVTLSTSPYSLFRLFTPETEENFRDYDLWRRIGVSVTYALDDGQARSAANLDPQKITEWSLRVRALGDRSPRSTRTQELWQEKIQPLIRERLDTLVSIIETILNDTTSSLATQSVSVYETTFERVDNYLRDSAAVPAGRKSESVTNMILTEIGNGIFQPVRAGELTVSPELANRIRTETVPALHATHEALELARIETEVEELAEEVNKAPLLTLAYTNHRGIAGMMSGYSDLKLLFAGFLDPLNVIVNAGIGLYHDPDDAVNQSRVRDASVGISLEAEFDNVFVGNADPADLSKITFALTGRYRRLEEVDANIGVLQAKLNIPIMNGMALPISVTYASRTEFINEKEVRGNFGITFDLDHLFALGQAAIPQQ